MEKKENRFKAAARKREVLARNELKASSEDLAMGNPGKAAWEGMKDMSFIIWGGIPGVLIKNKPVVFFSGFVISALGHYTGYRYLRRFGMGMMGVPVIQMVSALNGNDNTSAIKERWEAYKQSVLERFGVSSLLKKTKTEPTTNVPTTETPAISSDISSFTGFGNVRYFNYSNNKNQSSMNGVTVQGIEDLDKIIEQYNQNAKEYAQHTTAEQRKSMGIHGTVGEAPSIKNGSKVNYPIDIQERLL